MHKAATYLPLLEAVGAPVVAGPYEYTVSEDERRAARELLRPHANGEPDGPLVVLHPGANWPHKRWPPERFAALGERVAASHKARLLVTGGPEDLPLARAVMEGLRRPSTRARDGVLSGVEGRHPATLLAGRTTLRQLGACLEQAALVVSNDTGILHVAAALGRPVVALYGPTSPALTGPLGDPKRIAVLHHPDCCPAIPCYRPEHPAHPGMDAITVDEAFEAATRLLGQTSDMRQET
jgi:ADP-heptose:LPS heptosyltransferase